MKKFILFFACFLLMVAIGESQNSVISNAGNYHNEGLSEILEYYQNNPSEQKTIQKAYDIASQYFSSEYNMEVPPLSNEVRNALTQIVQEGNYQTIVQMGKSFLISLQGKINATEYQMTLDLVTFLEQTPYSESSVRARLNSVKNQYQGISWLAYEGNLIGGFVNVALGSLDFWNGGGDHGGEDPQGLWWVKDVAGYLGTWAVLYISECTGDNDACPGSVCECPGGGTRINASLAGGVTASGM